MKKLLPPQITIAFWLCLMNAVSAQSFFFASNQQKPSESEAIPKLVPKGRLLASVITEIKNHYGVQFMYEDKVVAGKTVSGAVSLDAKIEKTLESLLKPVGLKYKRVKAGTYVITDKRQRSDEVNAPNDNTTFNPISAPSVLGNFGSAAPMRAEVTPRTFAPTDIPVVGKVLDANGRGLPGANVKVKGTSKGTTTNADGGFAIEVPNRSAVLIVTFVGFKTQEITVANQTKLAHSLGCYR